ncbi:MAG: sialidase family protein [Gammaproteobacteria bacterium]
MRRSSISHPHHAPRGPRRCGHRARAIAGLAFLTVALAGCATLPTGASATADVSGLVASVTFAPDGRLWRARAEADRIVVDHSGDLGVSFSTPVAVNVTSQRIQALPEDRPAIAVDPSGRVGVVYYAEESRGGVVPYFSYSVDRGRHFGAPRPLSTPGADVEHSMVKLAVSGSGDVHLFWYETRGHGGGTSLFYTAADRLDGLSAPERQIAGAMCECCRFALDFDQRGRPVLLARVIFPDGIRDHALLTVEPMSSHRVTDDGWRIDACPKHGPALSITEDGRYHIAWFTQGDKRQGLFYSHSDNGGQDFSPPLGFGKPDLLAEHADVLALGNRVVLAWKEFDGHTTRLLAMQSQDRGTRWSGATVIGESNAESDHPDLITNGQRIFVSWSALDHGYKFVPIL